MEILIICIALMLGLSAQGSEDRLSKKEPKGTGSTQTETGAFCDIDQYEAMVKKMVEERASRAAGINWGEEITDSDALFCEPK
jgi:hypothetical protein